MLKKPAGHFRRIGTGVERAVIGEHVDAQTGDLAFLGRRDFGGHVIVARKGSGCEVLDAVSTHFTGLPVTI